MVGVFLEAATRRCEIKINWQMFAIPVPVSARRAESMAGEQRIHGALCRHLCPSPEGLPVTPPQFTCAREFELLLGTIPYEEKPQFFEAPVEAEEISREEEGGRCSYRGQAGWFGDRVVLTTTLFVSEECRPKCHALIVPFAPFGFPASREDLQSILWSVLWFVNCDLETLNFHGGSVKAFELFLFGENR